MNTEQYRNDLWMLAHVGLPLNVMGKPYSGENISTLNLVKFDKGYGSPFWLTFEAVKRLGGRIKKGERATRIFYATPIETCNATKSWKYEKTYFWLFNADQVKGLPKVYYEFSSTKFWNAV